MNNELELQWEAEWEAYGCMILLMSVRSFDLGSKTFNRGGVTFATGF